MKNAHNRAAAIIYRALFAIGVVAVAVGVTRTDYLPVERLAPIGLCFVFAAALEALVWAGMEMGYAFARAREKAAPSVQPVLVSEQVPVEHIAVRDIPHVAIRMCALVAHACEVPDSYTVINWLDERVTNGTSQREDRA